MRLRASTDSVIFAERMSHFLASSGSDLRSARPSVFCALMSSYSAFFLSCAMDAASPALAFSAVCSGVSGFFTGAVLTWGLAGFGGSLTVLRTRLASSLVLASAFSWSYAWRFPLSISIVSLMM